MTLNSSNLICSSAFSSSYTSSATIFFSFIISTILSTSNLLSCGDNIVSHTYFILNFVSKNRACAGLVLK